MKSLILIGVAVSTIACSDEFIRERDNDQTPTRNMPESGVYMTEPFDVEIDTRPFLEFGVSPVGFYTSEQVTLFNGYLANDIANKAGLRNKTVEAADFLMRFARVIPYAYEYGRPDYKYVARYAKTGMFLENYTECSYTFQSWGRPVAVIPPYYDYVSNLGSTYINGLHCSGFISWCLHNAGYSKPTIVNLDTVTANGYGVFPETYKLNLAANPDSIEVGDLLHFPGHAAIVTKIDSNWVTISESALWSNNHADVRNGTRKRKFDRYRSDLANYRFKSIVKMSGAYNEI